MWSSHPDVGSVLGEIVRAYLVIPIAPRLFIPTASAERTVPDKVLHSGKIRDKSTRTPAAGQLTVMQ